MFEGENLPVQRLFVVTGAFAFSVLAIVLCLTGLLYWDQEQRDLAAGATRPSWSTAQHELEAERASTYGWVDREAGTVRIPAARAAGLLLQEAGQ